MDVAESTALSASSEDDFGFETYNYTDAKNNSLPKTFSSHFGGEVNLDASAVHVPTTVYSHATDVIKAIRWSQELDETFK